VGPWLMGAFARAALIVVLAILAGMIWMRFLALLPVGFTLARSAFRLAIGAPLGWMILNEAV
jgi:hypothetical protein